MPLNPCQILMEPAAGKTTTHELRNGIPEVPPGTQQFRREIFQFPFRGFSKCVKIENRVFGDCLGLVRGRRQSCREAEVILDKNTFRGKLVPPLRCFFSIFFLPGVAECSFACRRAAASGAQKARAPLRGDRASGATLHSATSEKKIEKRQRRGRTNQDNSERTAAPPRLLLRRSRNLWIKFEKKQRRGRTSKGQLNSRPSPPIHWRGDA